MPESVERKSELAPGFFGAQGKPDAGEDVERPAPEVAGASKRVRKTFSLDTDVIEGIQQIVDELAEAGVVTDDGRPINEHYLVSRILLPTVLDAVRTGVIQFDTKRVERMETVVSIGAK